MATEGSGDGFSFGDIEVYIGDHDDMWSRAQAAGIPYEAIANTNYIANMVNSKDYFSDRKNRYPRFKSLPEGVTAWEYLEGLSRAGLSKKNGFPLSQEYEDRLAKELRVFKKMGLCDYMLIVQEYVRAAEEVGCLVGPGRGSCVGSLVAYALDITKLDPIKYGLLFERMLNPGRAGTPLIF